MLLIRQRKSGNTFINLLLSVLLTLSAFSFLFRPAFYHWLIFPSIYCGMLFSYDLIRLIRKEIDIFDPLTIIAIIGFHAYFIAPILHIKWDMITGELFFKGDWKHWIGVICIINAASLTIFRITQGISQVFFLTKLRRKSVPAEKISIKRFKAAFFFIFSISFFSQIYIYWKFSGIKNYISMLSAGEANLSGKGWIIMLADPLPLLCILAVIILFLHKKSRRKSALVYGIFLLFISFQFLLTGFSGSRSRVVYPIFIAAGFFHYYVRMFTLKELTAGILSVLIFMYIYGFYKELRWHKTVDFSLTNAVGDGEYRNRLERKTKRTMEGILLGDLARNDVQARIAEVIVGNLQKYELKCGSTYTAAFSLIIPNRIWNIFTDKPKLGGLAKRMAFEEILLNNKKGRLYGRYRLPTRIYGLTGEALMNFGITGVFVFHCFFGFFVGYYRAGTNTYNKFDRRFLQIPIIAAIFFHILFLDMSNVIWFAFRQCFLLVILLRISSKKIKILKRNISNKNHIRKKYETDTMPHTAVYLSEYERV